MSQTAQGSGTVVFQRRREFLPYAMPSIGEEEIAEVADSMRSGWITTGPKVAQFEEDFARYTGCVDAVSVNSCTAGLQIALAVFGVGPGDEVIVPALTFCATANVVVHTGARPVIVDVDATGNMDVQAASRAITPKTKALMPVHFAGQPADVDALYKLAGQHGLAVIEDAAHAVGAVHRGQKLASRAYFDSCNPATVPAAVVFSFYANKNMTTAEGGMIVFADERRSDQARMLRLHGMSIDAWKRYSGSGSWYYEVEAAGFKCNLTDIAAAIGIHQLRKLDTFTAARKALAKHYDAELSGIAEIAPPTRIPQRDHVYHLYTIAVDNARVSRNRLIEELRERNIGTSVHFIPIHSHPFYAATYGYRAGDFPVAESHYARTISLPLYPAMSKADTGYVIAALRDSLPYAGR